MDKTSENIEETGCYNCTDAHVAEKSSLAHTGDCMNSAHTIRLSGFSPPTKARAAFEIAGAVNSRRASISKTLFTFPFLYVQAYIQMRRVMRHLHRDAHVAESQWNAVVNRLRSRTEPVFISGSELQALIDSTSKHSEELSECLRQLPSIARWFPKTCGSIEVSINRILKSYNNCRVFGGTSSQAIESARRHYESGTLMDLDTFANGLQGN